MDFNLNLNEIERRANQAVFKDGLTEMLMGAFLIFYGGVLTTKAVPFFPFIIVVIFFGKPIIEKIKEKYIYPRAGYVKLPPEPQSTYNGIGISVIAMVIGLIALMGASILIKGTTQGITFFLTYIVPPVTGVFMAIGPFWMAKNFSIWRGYIWAALFVLSGIAMPLFNIEIGYSAVGLMCTVVGFIILITGTTIFFRFLRNNEPVASY